MSQSEAGFLNGEMKTMQQIKNDQLKVAKVIQTSLGQSAVPQAGAFQSNVTQPAVNQSVMPQIGVNQTGVQLGINQPIIPQPIT